MTYYASKNTFIRVIRDAIDRDDMTTIRNWICDHVISTEHESYQDAIHIFQQAQITLCQSFLRRSNTESIKILLDMYKEFKEPSVHALELNMIKNVVELELNADLLLDSSKTFLKDQANSHFGLENISQDNQQICDNIITLLGDTAS